MEKSLRDKYIVYSIEIIDKELRFFAKRHYIKHFMSPHDIEDMRSECILEVIKAIDRFDQSKKVKLNTYLTPRILGVFKDYLAKEFRDKDFKVDIGNMLDKVEHDISDIFSLNYNQATMYIKEIDFSRDYVKNIKNELPEIYNLQTYQIMDSILELPENKIYIVLGYYILNKSIKEIAEDLNISANSGYCYKLKKKGLDILRNKLREKKLLTY